MMKNKTLKKLLLGFRRVDLFYLAALKGLRGVSKCRKEELAERLAEYMLKPDVMMRYFQWLRDDEIGQLMSDQPPELICQCEYTEYIGASVFHLPEEVLTAYRVIDTPDFHWKRKQYSYIWSCLKTVGNLYGFAPISVVAKLAWKNLKLEITEEIIRTALNELPSEMKHYELHGERVVHRDICGLEELPAMQQGNVSYYIPSREEIEEIGRCRWLSGTAGAEELRRHLKETSNDADGNIEEMLYLIWKSFSMGCEISDVMGLLEHYILLMDDVERIQLIEPVVKMYENTRLMICRGFTRKELGRC